MNKLYAFVIASFFTTVLNAQTTQDTIDHPYWQGMMFDRTVNINKTRRAFDLYFSNKPKVKGSGYKQFERWYHYWSAKCDASGNFPPADRAISEYKKFLRNNLTPRSSTGNWSNLGPLVGPPSTTGIPIGTGRINGIAFHPTDPNKIYAGAPQGGFWRTVDKGANWVSSTDNLPTLGVSDIAVIPQTAPAEPIIFIGTGDRDAGDANGMGVYKSTDGGVTFTVSNTGMGNRTVNKIVANSLNPNTLVAATSNGIYTSYNQGASWTLRTANADFKDIKYCPNDTMYLYATQAGNYYRSTNGGVTWVNLTSSAGLTGSRTRMALAVTPHNPDIVYLVAANPALQAVYKSSNKGATFTTKATTPNMFSNQGWYNIAIEASQTDSNNVFIGGLDIYKSTNGATSFTKVGSWTGSGAPWVHADCHFLGRNPLNNELWIGTDGAIDFTTNEGSSYTHRDNGLAISQIYNLGVSQKSKTRFITGLQDNGTLVGSSPTTWYARVGGDGMQCEISNLDTTKMFGCIQNGELRRSTNNGTTWTDVSGTITGTGPWVTPYHLHPRLNDIMVLIYQNAHISKNIITAGSPSFTAFTSGITQNGTALRFSNVNDSLVFMGWSNGAVRYANILASTPTVTVVANPNGANSITDIETSYNNEDVIYATSGTRVYRSSNKGVSWTNISSNLPNIAMLSIVLDKNSAEGLYVGTEAGVYYKDSLTSTWSLFNTGLPANSEIRDLEIVFDTVCSSKSVIFAATYGRGLWKGDLYIDQTEPVPNFTSPATGVINGPVSITNTTTNNTNANYLWTVTPSAGVSFVSSTTNTSQDPVINFANIGTYTIKLKAHKPYGGFCTTSKTINITASAGSIVLNSAADTNICVGDTAIISVSGKQTYAFFPTTNLIQINDSTAKVFPTTTTNYRIIGTTSGVNDTVYANFNVKPYPSYTKTGNTTYCAGGSSTISFTNIDTAFWSPTTSLSNITPLSVDVVSGTDITYNVRLAKSGMCDINLTIPILVKEIPIFQIDKSSPQSLCVGDSIDISDTGTVNNLTWTPMSGVTALNAFTFRFKPVVTTKYYLSTTDTNYCAGYKDSITLNALPSPIISVSGPNVACAGNSIQLIATGATTYTWSPSTYLSATNKDTVIATPTSNIVYTITGYDGSCSGSVQKTIMVGTSTVKLNLIGKTEACYGNSINLIVSGADSLKWSPSNLVSNEFNDTVRVYTLVDTTLKVVGINTGCYDSLLIPLKIRPIPTISYQASTLNPICAGDKVGVKMSGATQYSIDPIYNTTKYQLDSFTLTPSITQKYFIYGSNQYGCSTKDSITVNVNPLPTITITPANSTIKRGQSLSITATGGTTYTWSPSKYIQGSTNIGTITVQPDSDIVYNVDVTTAAGCKSKGIAIVFVQQNPNPPSSIASQQTVNVLIYPNPTQKELNIDASEPLRAAIYSTSGALIKEFNLFEKTQLLNVEELSNGIYILSLETKSGKKKVSKVEISK